MVNPFLVSIIVELYGTTLHTATVFTGNSGEVTFADLPLGRRGVYNLTIAGTATTGETIVIYRTFRTGIGIILCYIDPFIATNPMIDPRIRKR